MTVAQKIKSRVDELEASQQEALLEFLESMSKPGAPTKANARRRRSRKAEIRAAVRGIAGIWKDRTDLPKDPVEAVKVLRERMRSREKNG